MPPQTRTKLQYNISVHSRHIFTQNTSKLASYGYCENYIYIHTHTNTHTHAYILNSGAVLYNITYPYNLNNCAGVC